MSEDLPSDITTSNGIRAEMLQRAARLMHSTENEEAWQLIGLFQETQPITFLRICHRILASFLELTHDYFDQGWPLKSRLLSTSNYTGGSMSERNRRRDKTRSLVLDTSANEYRETGINDHVLLSACHITKLQGHAPDSPAVRSSFMDCDSPAQSPAGRVRQPPNSLAKLRNNAARRLFKQILPSKPSHMNHNAGGTKMSCTRPERLVQSRPLIQDLLFSPSAETDTWTHPCVLSNVPVMKGIVSPESDSVDSTICRCLIEYMLDTPALHSTEGLFRIPGNSQRIRDLWIQMQDYFRTPYLRMPQPEPDSPHGCDTPRWDRWDIYGILGSYSPHDLASLLLRTVVTCSRSVPSSSSSKYPPRHLWNDDFSADSYSTHGLIPAKASELCFLATRLQYALAETNARLPCQDWVPILCKARQLLTYRIVLQLLLPSPERNILIGLLQLFRCVSQANATSRMSAESLARCAAVAVFGAPSVTNTPEQLSTSGTEDNPLRWRIDTLTNLINMADKLLALPELVYTTVRNRLRVRFGHSPIQRVPLTPLNVCNSLPANDSNCHTMHPKRRRRTNPRSVPEWVPRNARVETIPGTASLKTNPSSMVTLSTPARVSMHRSVSTMEPNPCLNRPYKPRGLAGAEVFQFWRRLKPTAGQQHQHTNMHRIPKARSAITLKHGCNRPKEAAI